MLVTKPPVENDNMTLLYKFRIGNRNIHLEKIKQTFNKTNIEIERTWMLKIFGAKSQKKEEETTIHYFGVKIIKYRKRARILWIKRHQTLRRVD